MTVDPATRRANRWLFAALILFCIGLCAVCLLWMRAKTKADGGKVYPPPAVFSQPRRCQPALFAASFA